MDAATKGYWEKEIAKHVKAAETFRAKAKRTGEVRWQRQADSNANRAWGMRNWLNEQESDATMPTDAQFMAALGPCGK